MNKIRYCSGCGVRMQDENILNIGFTTNLDNELCMRCFRLKNYGEYESVSSNVIDYEKIINGILRIVSSSFTSLHKRCPSILGISISLTIK